MHLIASSPFATDALASCVRLLGEGDGLLLCGEAVNALRPQAAASAVLATLPAGCQLFVLEEDALARAIAIEAPVQSVDYPDFVALTLQFDKVNSWL
nr:sulfurtransferase complex subunit TusB [Pseudomonas sp. NW5]